MKTHQKETNISCLFLKFGTYENCDDLLKNGTIYCSPITGFIKEDGTGRQDRNENVNELFCGEMKLKMIDYPQLDIPLIPAQLKFRNAPMHNIYCMCAIDYGKLSNGRYLIDKRFKSDFGSHFVLISNTTEFAKRLSAAINNTGYPVAHGPVRYRPLKEYTGILDDFTKDEVFSWQDEYRFKFYSGLNEKLVISIGNMEDIAVLMSSETKHLEFDIR